VAGPEVLGCGPERDVGTPGEQARRATAAARRQRWIGLAGTVLVVAAAGVLAGRSLPEPAPPPAAPTPTPVVPTPVRFVADAAVGTRWAYALVASCLGPETTQQCTYQLMRRSLAGGGWTGTAVQTGQVTGALGPARLFVTGADQVTVLDQPTVGTAYTSADGGGTVSGHSLRSGPPVAAVPPGAILDRGLCETCFTRLTVLEPRTGQLRPLATRPPLGPSLPVRSLVESDGTLWVLGGGGSRLVSVVSTDGGRSWRKLPVRGARAPADIVRLVSDGGRGAFLLIGWDARPDVLSEFSELWRVGDPARPGAAWRQVTPAVRPRSAVGLVAGRRGLIVTEETGQLWRLVADGTMRRLPPVDFDGVLIPAGAPVTGPGRVLLGIPANQPDIGAPTVMLSYDEGETWLVEQIRA
jgi:hypothetical protein